MPGIPVVAQHVVALLRHPDVGRRPAVHGEEASGVRSVARARAELVVGADRERLPLPPDDVSEHVIRDVGVVPSPRVPPASADRRVPMHYVHDTAHLPPELAFPGRLVVVAASRQLCPDALYHPESQRRVRVIPRLEAAVKRGWQNGVQAHDVRMRARDEAEPAGICGIVFGKVGWEPAGQRRAKVDPFHIEGLPPRVGANLEHFPERARGNLGLGRAGRWLQRQPAVHAPGEQGVERVVVARRNSQGLPPRSDRLRAASQPLAREAQPVPGVAVDGIAAQRRREVPLGGGVFPSA